jgi:hypothetical protein
MYAAKTIAQCRLSHYLAQLEVEDTRGSRLTGGRGPRALWSLQWVVVVLPLVRLLPGPRGDRRQHSGRYEETLDVSGLASGTYVVRLTTGATVQTEKLTVVR